MTNEQLTQEFLKLAEHQAKCDAERENMLMIIEELKEDVKSTKSLAEDVHIMAINMKTMQEVQEETKKETNKQLEEINVKVNALNSKEFTNYQENKKIIKDKIIGAIGGTLGTGLIAFILWAINKFM